MRALLKYFNRFFSKRMHITLNYIVGFYDLYNVIFF